MGAAGGVAQAGLGAFQLIEAKGQADALERQANFDAQQAEFNAQLLELRRPDIEAKRDEDVLRREQQVRQMIGSQRASLAAQGIEVNSELGQELAEAEALMGQEDVQAIRNNAWREAMGLEIEAEDLRTQAKVSRLEGRSKARSAIFSGGLSAAGNFISAGESFRDARFGRSRVKPKTGGRRVTGNFRTISTGGLA